MGRETSIGWCDHTFNPWWGCVKVSPGCENCYAETFSKRTGHSIWGPAKTTGRRTGFTPGHWRQPLDWNEAAEKARERRRVFCGSMCDIFEKHPAVIHARAQTMRLVLQTPWLDWLFLTKRPENVPRMVVRGWLDGDWPRNAWIGTSVEDQRRADERIPHLLALPAPVRFLSMEPLLGQVDLIGKDTQSSALHPYEDDPKIGWVIVGGESGPGARRMDPAWAEKIVADCKDAGVPVFMKQMGAVRAREVQADDDPKGEDMSWWPHWLRVQEFPRSAA